MSALSPSPASIFTCTLLSPPVFSCFFITSYAKRIELSHECSSQGMRGVGWMIACTGFEYYSEIVYGCTKWIQNFGKVQNMDPGHGPWSMDPLCGPGPQNVSIKIWTGSMEGVVKIGGPWIRSIFWWTQSMDQGSMFCTFPKTSSTYKSLTNKFNISLSLFVQVM